MKSSRAVTGRDRTPSASELKQGGIESEDPWKIVVGVYADLKHLGPQAETRPEVMFPYAQTARVLGNTIYARSLGGDAHDGRSDEFGAGRAPRSPSRSTRRFRSSSRKG